MELEWKWNGTFMKKFGDEKWNGNREEMERKWNGNFMKKFVDAKWNGNRVEMERKWNGKKERPMILANGFGNGMEWKRNGNGILASYLWNLSIGILRSFYQFHVEPFHQIPFHSMEFHFPFKNPDLWQRLIGFFYPFLSFFIHLEKNG